MNGTEECGENEGEFGGCIAGPLMGGSVVYRCFSTLFESSDPCIFLTRGMDSKKILCCSTDLCNTRDEYQKFLANQTMSSTGAATGMPTGTAIPTDTPKPSPSISGESITPHSSSLTTSSSTSPTEQSSSSDSSLSAHAIALSIILPLIIIGVFGIAIVIFLLYMRLYIKYKRERLSSDFKQVY